MKDSKKKQIKPGQKVQVQATVESVKGDELTLEISDKTGTRRHLVTLNGSQATDSVTVIK